MITIMAQEEETQKCSNSNSGSVSGGNGFSNGNIGRSSKKQKQKKVPQRGLGVAQLEKIRLEEQQKKDGSIVLPSPPHISTTKTFSHSGHVQNFQSYTPSGTCPSDLSPPSSIIRPQNIDVVSSNTVPLVSPLGWQPVSLQGHRNVHKIWNSCEYHLEKESCGVDPGLSFRSSLHLPYESNPIWPLPSLMQSAQQKYQQPSSSSASMVNVSSASSSSVLNFQMEPPSNQSYYGNCTPVWPDEEKMVGMKRPYPFSLDNPQGPSSHCKFPPIVQPISRTDESASFGNGSTSNFNSGSLNFREGPPCSSSILEPNLKKSIKGNGTLNRDFLTLSPPITTLTCSNSKGPSTYPAFYNYEAFDFGRLPYQGNMEDPIPQPVPSVSSQQQPYYCFLPQKIVQIDQATKTISNCNGGEVGENIDLNLKL